MLTWVKFQTNQLSTSLSNVVHRVPFHAQQFLHNIQLYMDNTLLTLRIAQQKQKLETSIGMREGN